MNMVEIIPKTKSEVFETKEQKIKTYSNIF